METNEGRKTKKWMIAVFVVGVVALVAGLVVLIVNLVSKPPVSEVDYLVSAGEWAREDDPDVIWDFVDNEQGSLTTDGHLNNYPFVWSLVDGKITLNTTWLYDLSDEFDFKLDQGAKTFTIKNDNAEVTFKLQEKTE